MSTLSGTGVFGSNPQIVLSQTPAAPGLSCGPRAAAIALHCPYAIQTGERCDMVEIVRNANNLKKPGLNDKSATEKVKANDSVGRFMALFGLLKGSKAFEGDAVDIQREMRDEWR